jgi:hypothetical protein
MRRRLLFGLVIVALAAAAVFAIWPAVGDAPWLETKPTTPVTPYFASADVLSLATVQVATRGGASNGHHVGAVHRTVLPAAEQHMAGDMHTQPVRHRQNVRLQRPDR